MDSKWKSHFFISIYLKWFSNLKFPKYPLITTYPILFLSMCSVIALLVTVALTATAYQRDEIKRKTNLHRTDRKEKASVLSLPYYLRLI